MSNEKPQGRKLLWLWYLISLVAVGMDMLTKYVAVAWIKPRTMHTLPIIKDWLHLTYTENRGAAFSMLSGDDQRWIFMLISGVAIVLMAAVLFFMRNRSAWFCVPLAMVMGGGIGNMIDRFRLGYVVDFIDVRCIDFAIFNVADCFVCVGCGLLFIYLLFLDGKAEHPVFREEKKTRKPVKTTENTGDGDANDGSN